MIIGLSGYATAGKDALGRFLVDDHGYVRYSFADVLRECLYALNPVVDLMGGGFIRVRQIVDAIGWDRAKTENDEIRRLLQALGTEVGRNILGENLWVDAVFRKIEANGDKLVVITDVRFPNEAHAVKDHGGYVVRIQRPGVTAINDHPSETSLDDWDFDYRVSNEGELHHLRRAASKLAEGIDHLDTVMDGGPSERLPGYGSRIAR